jgi:ketosteroid isomerase-like protein
MSPNDQKLALDPQDLARLLVARANAGDVEGMAALYEPDAVLSVGEGKVACGTAEIRAFYARLLATGLTFNLGAQRPAIFSGELALTSTRLPNGTITAEVARKQLDGSWRWVIDQPAIAK